MKNAVAAAAILCAVVVASMFTPTANVEAAGMSVGASTWYSQWKYESPSTGTMKSDWTLMYGPSIGIDCADNWSLTSVLLSGNYHFKDDSLGLDFNYRRYDSDTTLNYSVFKWLKVFGGFKYMRYDIRNNFSVIPPFGFAQSRHYTYGPGLGLGLTIPLHESLFALATFSAMRLSGQTSQDGEPVIRCVETGYNAAASLAYYIDSMATTLSLGVRYQYFKSEDRNVDWASSDLTFYGITFAAVYSFSLGSQE
jgi:hypothetical protein